MTISWVADISVAAVIPTRDRLESLSLLQLNTFYAVDSCFLSCYILVLKYQIFETPRPCLTARSMNAPFTFYLALICCVGNVSAQSPPLRLSVAEYSNKVLGSWLGQCIGNIYGLPHENRYIDTPGPERFPYGYGSNLKSLEKSEGAFSDDDTDIEYMYLLAMEKFGPEPSLAQLAAMWKHHVRERVWLANRGALAAMHHGYTPPITGDRRFNPHWFQIDPQLINEIWAVTAPGMVKYASAKSGWAAHIMDDDWGVEPTVFYGAMYSAAFFESDVDRLIDIGVANLRTGSRFAKTVDEMRGLHRQYPQDWKAARQKMAERYYHAEPLETRTIWNANLNAAAGVLAMLYGNGDFQRTLDLSCAMGFDADNQAATIAGLLGIIHGADKLPDALLYPLPKAGWQKPFNDRYKNVTRYDMPDASLEDLARRMAAQGERIILANGGRKVQIDGREMLQINPDAAFIAPLEAPAGPDPLIEQGRAADFQPAAFGGNPPYRWNLQSGRLPKGLRLNGGRIAGTAESAGIYRITLRVTDARGRRAEAALKLVVRPRNLAPAAAKVLASVEETDAALRDKMWLTVPRSLYAPRVEAIIRDGRTLGNGSTFYSIGSAERGEDFYGYEWRESQKLGLVAFHAGSVEENGGWFTSLRVEYRAANGGWAPAEELLVSPPIPSGDQPFNKPHFIEYLLAFKPVETKAIRIIGQPGRADHWRNSPARFTSITELAVYGPLPNYQDLNQ